MRLPLTITLLSSIAVAQTSSTLPSGWDNREGVDLTANSPSNFHPGWDILNGTTIYNPSRAINIYDSSAFPWAPTTSKVIRQLSVRRDGAVPAGPATAHTKKIRMILSNGARPAHRPHNALFDANHGPAPADVIGSKDKPVTINFKATPQPGTGQVAPFDVVFKFDRPFVVLANTKTLAIEIRSYEVSVSTGRWRVDSMHWSRASRDLGTTTAFYNTHCVTPNMTYSSRPAYLESGLAVIWNTMRAGKVAAAWIGTKLAAGIKIPGTGSSTDPQCELHVAPEAIVATVAASGPNGGAYFFWGTVPNDIGLLGVKIAHQGVVLDSTANPRGLAFTRALETTIASGFGADDVKGSQVYSFGDVSTVRRSDKLMNPDTEVHPRFFERRNVIFKVE